MKFMFSVRPLKIAPLVSQPMMSVTPACIRILEQATPDAPTPFTTTVRSARVRPVSLQAFIAAARTTMAVPCWSSWKTGMSNSALRRVLDREAGRRRDVLEVDAAVGRREGPADGDELLGVLGLDAHGVAVDVAEALEEHRLALHDRHAGRSADVAQPEHGGAVGDDRDHVALEGQVLRPLGVGCDRPGNRRDARAAELVEVRLGQSPGGRELDLASLVKAEGPVPVVDHAHAVDSRCGSDDRLSLWRIAGVDDYVAHQRAVVRDGLDSRDVATYARDRRDQPPEDRRLAGGGLDAKVDGVLSARIRWHDPS